MLRFPLIAAAALAVGTMAQAEGAAALGEKVFKKCAACHSADPEKRKPGPHLQAISGRAAGAVEGFRYSSAMADSGLVWDDETLRAFLANPKGVVKRTKMSFPGLKKDEDLDNIVAYLKGL